MLSNAVSSSPNDLESPTLPQASNHYQPHTNLRCADFQATSNAASSPSYHGSLSAATSQQQAANDPLPGENSKLEPTITTTGDGGCVPNNDYREPPCSTLDELNTLRSPGDSIKVVSSIEIKPDSSKLDRASSVENISGESYCVY